MKTFFDPPSHVRPVQIRIIRESQMYLLPSIVSLSLFLLAPLPPVFVFQIGKDQNERIPAPLPLFFLTLFTPCPIMKSEIRNSDEVPLSFPVLLLSLQS